MTTMRVYWDRIAVGITDETVKPMMARLEPASADLRWRGFSAERTPDGREPFGYDYDEVARIAMEGAAGPIHAVRRRAGAAPQHATTSSSSHGPATRSR